MKEFTLRELDGGQIHGYHWPVSDPSRTVCIIHGIGEYGGRYDRVASKFNKAGFAVFSMDLRGHGLSIGKKGECAPRSEVLEDISTLISRAAREYPGTDVILYGHSLGGNITLDYRRRGALRDYPAAYLISAPWIRLVSSIPAPVYRITKLASKIMPKLIVGSTVKEENLGNPESVLPYHDDPMVHNKISLLAAIEGFETGKQLESDSKAADDDKVRNIPTLIMHGGEDRICSIEGSKAVYENYRKRGDNIHFKELPGIYHEIHNGGSVSNGDDVIDEMIGFIKDPAGFVQEA